MSVRPYRPPRGADRSEATRARIREAVRGLLSAGRFHASTMEEVAERAGVSRATLYQHFRSRLALVDAVCEDFARNPALRELRETVELDDAQSALAGTLAASVRFWSSEDAVLRELYGVVAVDPAAAALVERQRADRRGGCERLARNLERAGRLRAGVTRRRALELLLVLSSYHAYRELREAGLSDAQATVLLQETARDALLAS